MTGITFKVKERFPNFKKKPTKLKIFIVLNIIILGDYIFITFSPFYLIIGEKALKLGKI